MVILFCLLRFVPSFTRKVLNLGVPRGSERSRFSMCWIRHLPNDLGTNGALLFSVRMFTHFQLSWLSVLCICAPRDCIRVSALRYGRGLPSHDDMRHRLTCCYLNMFSPDLCLACQKHGNDNYTWPGHSRSDSGTCQLGIAAPFGRDIWDRKKRLMT